MTAVDAAALERAIEDLPRRFPGPGGAVAVVKDGVPIIRHGWGFANLETRQPYTPATIAPLCSITKQFTCAALLAVAPDPAALDPLIAAQLPRLEGEKPTTLDLANNQSGLRDYWALTVLCGAMPEGAFRPADAVTLIGRTRSLHFRPGTAYSYSNGNFRMLARAVEQVSGREFGELLAERLLAPAGMASAVFAPETGALPGGATGYEGTLATGWRAGVNRLHWAGDAGLCASLDDMIAWERFIDRTRDEAGSPYQRLSRTPATFRNGAPAGYRLGLVRRTRWGRAMSGHGGAIRGWRLARHYVPSERLSVALAFNHESDSFGAAMAVLAAALGESDRPAPSVAETARGFAGSYLDAATGLLLDVAVNADGTLAATYDGGAEVLSVGEDGVARGLDMTLTQQPEGILVERPDDAIRALARPLGGWDACGAVDIAGRYASPELESEMAVVDAGGSLFAGFRGFLGSGPLMALVPAGEGVWRLACRRSLDAPAPGDWTVRANRAEDGTVTGLRVGCWLARDVVFPRAA